MGRGHGPTSPVGRSQGLGSRTGLAAPGAGVGGVGVAIPLLPVGPGPHVLDSGSLYQGVELEFDICFYNQVCYCSGNLEFCELGFSCCLISDAFGSVLGKSLSVA